MADTLPPRPPRWRELLARIAAALLVVLAGRVLLRLARVASVVRRWLAPARASREPHVPHVAPSDRSAPLFARRATAILLGTLAALAIAAAGGVALALGWVRTPYSTGQYAVVMQPVPFSHQLHVTGFEIDCRYCHATVERAPTAGMPDTRTCVPCHNDTWLDGPWFEPVRRSLATGQPIPWRRVNDLPDHTFFDHAVHARRAIPCATCHGEVEQMAVVRQTVPLTMKWCLDCHMNPEPWLRAAPGSTVRPAFRPEQQVPPPAPEALGAVVNRLTTCTACHR